MSAWQRSFVASACSLPFSWSKHLAGDGTAPVSHRLESSPASNKPYSPDQLSDNLSVSSREGQSPTLGGGRLRCACCVCPNGPHRRAKPSDSIDPGAAGAAWC